jgi:CRISPR-associated protein Cas1
MIKRTVEVSGDGNHLSVCMGSLVVRRGEEEVGRVPLEDIGVLILDSQTLTYTHAVLAEVLGAGAVIIPCGRNHLPAGVFLPQTNVLQTQRIARQAAAPLPLRKSLWKQIVQAKLAGQADVLGMDHPAARAIRNMIPQVRSGDPTNIEAQAARIYWSAFLPEGAFRRDREGPSPNNLLNYGYMVLRAAVARAICGAGLHPSLGLHHHNRSDAFCLADDLVEPLRPLVDRKVLDLWSAGKTRIDRETKTELLSLLTAEVAVADLKGPLMVALERTTASLVRCYEGQDRKLALPVLWT